MITFNAKTYRTARQQLAQLGVILHWIEEWEEYTVKLRGAHKATTYHTKDLQDAVDTGHAMLRHRTAAAAV